MFNTVRYKELKHKKVNQIPLTPAEATELGRMSLYAALNPSVMKSVEEPSKPKQVLFTNDAQADNSYKQQQALLKQRAEQSSILSDTPSDENIFISKKEISQATGLDEELIRAATRRGAVKSVGEDIDVKSFTEYVTKQLADSWAKYQMYETAKEALES